MRGLGLDREDTSLIELARRGHDPTDSDLRRVATSLEGRLNVPLCPLTLGPTLERLSSEPLSTPPLAGTSLGLTTFVAFTLCTLAVTVGLRHRGLVAMSDNSRAMSSSVAGNANPSRPSPGTTNPPLGALSIAHTASLSTPDRRPVFVDSAPTRVHTSKRRFTGRAVEAQARPEADTTHQAIVESPLEPSTLEAETSLLRAALRLLHEQQPAQALTLLEEHERSYPSGVLAEERDAKIVVALCDLGRADVARSRARNFASAYPDSLLIGQVRAACPAPAIIP